MLLSTSLEFQWLVRNLRGELTVLPGMAPTSDVAVETGGFMHAFMKALHTSSAKVCGGVCEEDTCWHCAPPRDSTVHVPPCGQYVQGPVTYSTVVVAM